MKICVFSPYFGGGYGTGHSIKKEVEQLALRGHEIFIIHSQRDIDKQNNSKINYFYFEYPKIPILNILILKRCLNSLFKSVLKNKIDILYVQSLEFGLVKNNIVDKIPIVYFARGTTKGVEKNKSQEFWLDSIRRKFITPILIYLEKRCLKNSQAVVVKSNIMKKELVELYKIAKDKIHVIRGGIDNSVFPKMTSKQINEFKKKNNLKEEDKIILFAGRIMPVKGLYYLIKAFTHLRGEMKNIKLLVVGDSIIGSYDKLIKKISSKFISNQEIIFTGYVPQKLMYKYFNISDIVVTPSTYEPFGMVNIQAIFFNKPLITTSNVGSVEIIKDYHSLRVVRPHNINELEHALNDMLVDNKKTVEIFKFKDLNWSDMVNKLEVLFNSLK